MTNILKNPRLEGFKLDRYFWDNSGNTGAIEFPTDWEFDATPQHPEDPGRIPQSLHREGQGFVISAGYRSWEAGYVQRGVQLRAGQRYLAKALFFADVNFPSGSQVDLSAIMWRFWVEQSGGGEKVFLDWQMTNKGSFKQDEELLFVFQCNADMLVDFYFKGRSYYPGNTCNLNVRSLTLEAVAADYGGSNVPMLGSSAAAVSSAPAPTTAAASMTTPAATTASAPAESSSASVAGLGIGGSAGSITLADVLTEADVEVIVAGLRRMDQVTQDQVVIEAFIRLADALEKLK